MRIWRQIHETVRNRVGVLWQAGKTQREIADEVCISRNSVRGVVRRLACPENVLSVINVVLAGAVFLCMFNKNTRKIAVSTVCVARGQ